MLSANHDSSAQERPDRCSTPHSSATYKLQSHPAQPQHNDGEQQRIALGGLGHKLCIALGGLRRLLHLELSDALSQGLVFALTGSALAPAALPVGLLYLAQIVLE